MNVVDDNPVSSTLLVHWADCEFGVPSSPSGLNSESW